MKTRRQTPRRNRRRGWQPGKALSALISGVWPWSAVRAGSASWP